MGYQRILCQYFCRNIDVIDLITGIPLKPGVTYKVAVNDFLANGGDVYDTLAGANKVETNVLVRDLVVEWVELNSPFKPPEPAVEMRITTLGTPPS
jgi:2',3'-cyclic-nucleotide 2'-phosphodiesterase (5'-nucleotidase family)